MAIKAYWRYRLREAGLIITLAMSVFLLLALCTYHRSDPSWSHHVSVNTVTNAAGRVGAWIADFIFYLVGYVAYLFPIMMTYAAWVSFSNRHDEDKTSEQWFVILFRSLGFCFIVFAAATLLHMNFLTQSTVLPFHSGGIFGMVISNLMLPVFNSTGTTLILLSLLLIGITLFTDVSWMWVMEQLGNGFLRVAGRFFAFIARLEWGILWRWLFKNRKEELSSSIVIPKKRAIKKLEPKLEPAFIEESMEALPKPKIMNRVVTEVHEAEFKAPRYSGSDIVPTLSLLNQPVVSREAAFDEAALKEKSKEVELRLADFGITATAVAILPGPVVTRYELQLAAGTKASKITNLAKDLARSLSVISVRVVEVIPGKSVIGLELPNKNREMVTLHEVLASKQYVNSRSALTLALGKDIAGHPVIVDLAKMPHLLVAGTTGSGKSISLNSMLLSLLYKSTPKQLRLILIDPKMLELSVYEGIPHLLTPVVTDMKDAALALRWSVGEMERRYKLMATLGVRNIAGYNLKVKTAKESGAPLLDPLHNKNEGVEPAELQELPQIVVIADEYADMMVVVGKKVETLIARLAQKARAAGIHLIFATQRPSVDVITGLIKANIPTRIAFQVSSKVDSRTILDQQGAEQLLGNGDMLYLAPGTGVPTRVHGAYVTDEEVHGVIEYLKKHSKPDYVPGVLDESQPADPTGFVDMASGEEADGEQDSLYDQAVDAVIRAQRVSVSSIQRRFKIGYNRAARIVEAMEAAGVVSSMETNGTREVLRPPLAED